MQAEPVDMCQVPAARHTKIEFDFVRHSQETSGQRPKACRGSRTRNNKSPCHDE